MFAFTVSRTNARRPSPAKIQAQLEKMVKAALRGNRGTTQGWFLANQIVPPAPRPVADGLYEYEFTFEFGRKTQRAVDHDVCVKQFNVLMEMAQQAGNLHQWNITDVKIDDEPVSVKPEARVASPPVKAVKPVEAHREPLAMSPIEVKSDLINLDPTGYFSHLYDREEQINVLLSGVRTAVESDFETRTHCLIEGDPAGGKTSLAKAFMSMVGEEYCHYIDMTTSTQAGILLELMEVPDTVRFVIIEEIEKVKSDDLRWLLGVMDERGEINVCNARVGVMRRKLPVYIIATVNDTAKLESFQSGAISSRFGDKIYCPRLSRKTIFKAVKQAVDKINGDDSWIDPAIDYVLNVEGTCDIRRIKAVALGGRDRLVTGEYQRILKATSRPR